MLNPCVGLYYFRQYKTVPHCLFRTTLCRKLCLSLAFSQYMLEPIPLFAIQTIVSMRLSSHALSCETWRWLCTFCPKQVWESEYHTLIQCYTFDHIWLCFPHIFNQTQSLHNFSCSYNAHSQLWYSSIMFLNIKSRYSFSCEHVIFLVV